MSTYTKKILIPFCLLWLAACSSPTPQATPTATDLDPVRTEVAATVLAQVTQTLAVATVEVQLETPIPTLEASATQAPTPSLAPTSPITPTQATPGTGTNLAKYVSQTIPDGTNFQPGETFSMTWTVQNVGTATWTANYLWRFYSGSAFGAPQEIQLGKQVAPGETTQLNLQMTAPTTPGEYTSTWVLANAARSNFREPVFVRIVVPAPTATPTRTPVPTRTVTPTNTAEPSATPTP